MADASKQVRPVETVSQSDTNTTHATDTALSRNVGGTGVSVGTMAELRTELGAGAASGLATLDSSVLVPVAQLPTMVGTSGSANGTRGTVPTPQGTGTASTSDTRRPLRGDGTYGGGAAGVSSAWLNQITDENGTEQIRVSNTERPTYKGDPFMSTIRAPRFIVGKAYGTTFDTVGLPTPTVTSPTAASSQVDATGSYVRLTNSPSTNAMLAGVSTTDTSRRGLTPEFYIMFRTSLLRSRAWVGLFESDPSGGTDLFSGSLHGVGLYYDRRVGAPATSNPIADVAVDGSAKTYTRTSGSFIADGFRVGLKVNWTGFANAGNNQAGATITTLTATVMTVTEASGTMTTEVAGASVFATGIIKTSALSGVVVDESSATYTRASGSFITDGFRVGMAPTWLGFSNAANNSGGTITALTDTVMTCGEASLVDESPGGTVTCESSTSPLWRFVTCTGGSTAADQTEVVTSIPAVANAYQVFRIRNVNSTDWECSNYDTATGSWINASTITTTSPGAAAALQIHASNRNIAGYTASGVSITVDAAAKTFTRASGSWIADGFRAGTATDAVTFTGFSNSGNNLSGAAITALDDTVMTIGAASGLTNETSASAVASSPATTLDVSHIVLNQE